MATDWSFLVCLGTIKKSPNKKMTFG
ncbi:MULTISPECIES: hypothetical protein [Bacillaceae]